MLHQLPPDLAAIDRDSRERFSIAAAYGFIWQFPPTLLAEIVARGEDEFIRLARTGFASQDFQLEDFQRMFRFIKRHVAQSKAQPTAGRIIHARH